MKYLIFSALFFFGTFATAQNVAYQNGEITYNDENIRTIDVILTPKVEPIKDRFEDWMNENYDVDLDGKKLLFFNKEFMSAKGVVIPQISNRQIDLLVKVDETDSGNTKLQVFSSFGYDNWIDEETYPYEYTALRAIVFDFVRDYLPEYYNNQIEKTEENITGIKEDIADLNYDMKDNEEEIKNLMDENKALMDKIGENQKKLSKAKSTLKKKKGDYNVIRKKVNNLDGK